MGEGGPGRIEGNHGGAGAAHGGIIIIIIVVIDRCGCFGGAGELKSIEI